MILILDIDASTKTEVCRSFSGLSPLQKNACVFSNEGKESFS